jgi:phosphatidylglycerol---prolipoprotein diacylglyceryl transferase
VLASRMHPILFTISGFDVHTYGFMGGVAFLVGAGIVLLRAKKLGVPMERTADLIFWLAVLSLLGARLVFVLQNPGSIDSLLQLFDIRGGGLVFYGSFVVGFPLGFVLMNRWDMPAFGMWDTMATAFPIAHGISRLGCYAAGCCYGIPTGTDAGVQFPEGSLAPPHVNLYPVQLYEAAALFGIGLLCNLFYARRSFDGQVMLLYLSLYAVSRAVLEVYRGDAERGWFMADQLGEMLTWSQGMSILLAIMAIAVFFIGARRSSAAA